MRAVRLGAVPTACSASRLLISSALSTSPASAVRDRPDHSSIVAVSAHVGIAGRPLCWRGGRFRNRRNRPSVPGYRGWITRISAASVLGDRDSFKMIGPHASSNSTQVIDLEPQGNVTHEEFICDAMSSRLSPPILALHGEGAISIGAGATRPQPTAIGALTDTF